MRPTDHVSGSNLRSPHPCEVRREHAGAQAHPFQTRVDDEPFDLFVPVASEARRLARGVLVGVDGRKGHEPDDAGIARRGYGRFERVGERPRIQEDGVRPR